MCRGVGARLVRSGVYVVGRDEELPRLVHIRAAGTAKKGRLGIYIYGFHELLNPSFIVGKTLAFAKRRTIVYRWVVQIAQFESSKHEKVDRQRRNSVVLVKVIQIY